MLWHEVQAHGIQSYSGDSSVQPRLKTTLLEFYVRCPKLETIDQIQTSGMFCLDGKVFGKFKIIVKI